MATDSLPFRSQIYRIPAAETIRLLETDPDAGLSKIEVERRRQRYGANVLEERGRRPAYRLFFNQFRDLLIGILLVAALLAYYLDDIRGAAILLAIILINAAIGFYQEYKADRLLEQLRTMILTRATAIRADARTEVEERDLVPGDIVVLEAGAAVPADIRLIETHEFATNDVILTGESLPQEKDAALVFDREMPVPFNNLVRGRESGVFGSRSITSRA
jgi:P-type Ca2+ transporter type 2C